MRARCGRQRVRRWSRGSGSAHTRGSTGRGPQGWGEFLIVDCGEVGKVEMNHVAPKSRVAWVAGRTNETFPQWLREPMPRDEEIGIGEGLDGPDRKYHLLPCAFGGFDLPVELAGVELTGLRLDATPVRPQPDQLERVGKQRLEGCPRVQSERLDLERTEADPQERRTARPDGQVLPGSGQGLYGSRDSRLRGYRHRHCTGGRERHADAGKHGV
jgi:hypothetical protein